MQTITVTLYNRSYRLFRFTALPNTPSEQVVTVAEHRLDTLVERRISQNRYREIQAVDEMYGYVLPKGTDLNNEREIRESIENILQ